MGTLNDKLNYMNETKTLIKNAIKNKGVTVSDTDTFRSYANKIGSISAGSTMQNVSSVISHGQEYGAGVINISKTFNIPAGYKIVILDLTITSVTTSPSLQSVSVTGSGVTVTEKMSKVLTQKVNGAFTLNVYRKSYILQRSSYSSATSVSVSANVNEGRTLTGTLIY